MPSTRNRISKKKTMIGLLFAGTLILGACGSSDDDKQAAPKTTKAPQSTPSTSAPAGSAVAVRTTGLGDVLVGDNGLTLYGFTNDVDAVPTCEGACADAWPPVLVDKNWTPGPGLDSGIFATAPRPDGTTQLVAGKWPLYYYSGDTAAGDVNGQGSGDVWFVVAPDGKLIKDPKPAGETPPADDTAIVTQADTDLGTVLVDNTGMTLYGFTNDSDGTPTCNDDCAGTWPALTVDGDQLPEGLDPEVFSIVDRADGTKQLKAGKWPLYRFSGDTAPGDTNGQGSGDVWFVVAPDGSLIKEAPPAESSQSTDDSESADDGGYSDDSGYYSDDSGY